MYQGVGFVTGAGARFGVRPGAGAGVLFEPGLTTAGEAVRGNCGFGVLPVADADVSIG